MLVLPCVQYSFTEIANIIHVIYFEIVKYLAEQPSAWPTDLPSLLVWLGSANQIVPFGPRDLIWLCGL